MTTTQAPELLLQHHLKKLRHRCLGRLAAAKGCLPECERGQRSAVKTPVGQLLCRGLRARVLDGGDRVDMISTYWEQLLLIGALIFHAARSYAQLSEMRKDIDQLQAEILRYTKWTQKQAEEIVELKSESRVLVKQVTSLWDFTNGLRDRLNGHGKH